MITYYFELLIHQVFIFNIDQMNQWGLYQNVRLTISEKQFLNISMHWCILFLSLAFHLLMFLVWSNDNSKLYEINRKEINHC